MSQPTLQDLQDLAKKTAALGEEITAGVTGLEKKVTAFEKKAKAFQAKRNDVTKKLQENQKTIDSIEKNITQTLRSA